MWVSVKAIARRGKRHSYFEASWSQTRTLNVLLEDGQIACMKKSERKGAGEAPSYLSRFVI